MPIVDVRMHQRCIHTLDKILSKVKTYYESQDPSIKVSYSYNAVKQMGGGSYHYLRDGYVIFYMEVAAGDAMGIRRQTYALPLKSTNISNVRANARGILIQNDNDFVTISGLNNNEQVIIYDISGSQLAAAKAVNGIATFGINKADKVVVVKIGNDSIKVQL